MLEESKQKPSYETRQLENGEPVYYFTNKGQSVDLTTEFGRAPTGKVLIKLKDGRTIAANRRAMVILDAPDEKGNFSKTKNTAGTVIATTYPKGIPEIKVGETWINSGEVERVAFASGYAYEQGPKLAPDAPTPGVNMFTSADEILSTFETSQPTD